MLLNLRKKIPDGHRILAYDTSIEAVNRIVQEAGQTVTVAPDLSVIARNAVMLPTVAPPSLTN